jgi:hypothetical protein
MKLFIRNIVLVLLSAIVVSAFADNDTTSFMEYYATSFEDSADNSQWSFKYSNQKNKWRIETIGDSNKCLHLSNNSQDTTYWKTANSVSYAYRKVSISSSDSLTLDFDVNVGGDGSNDYLKVMIVPKSFSITLPTSTTSSLGFAGAYYKDSAFVLDNEGHVYLSETNGWTHITTKKKNYLSCQEGYLLFIWRNDKISTGDAPGPIIDNIVLKGTIQEVNKSVCKGEAFTLNDKQITTSGTYYDTIAMESGCDSIVRYNVTMFDTFIVFIDKSICEGESLVLSDGTIATTSGFYVDNLQTINGCDSVVNTNLVVNQKANTILFDTICEGETYAENGFVLSLGGFYFDTLTTYKGCDSVVNLLLTVNEKYEQTYIEMICTGETFSKYGFNETASGYYTHSYQTVAGCDSVINLNLKVANIITKDIYDTICEGETYNNNGFIATTSGVYVDSLQSISGCDSVVTLHLTTNPTNDITSEVESVEICQGESIVFNNKTLVTSGYYVDTLQNIWGCDSITAINLVVNPIYWIKDSVTIQEGEKYKWNNKTYTQQGTYTDTLNSIKGCDSIVTLELIVLSSLVDIGNISSINIYPNPSKDIIIINNLSENAETTITLYDNLGKRVKQIKTSVNQITIDIKDLPEGTYILRIENKESKLEKKIIVQ